MDVPSIWLVPEFNSQTCPRIGFLPLDHSLSLGNAMSNKVPSRGWGTMSLDKDRPGSVRFDAVEASRGL